MRGAAVKEVKQSHTKEPNEKKKKIKHNGKSGLGGGERVGKGSAEEKP